MDLTKYSKGKRMVQEDKIKEIGENKADLEEIKAVLPKKVNSYIVENITSISGEILSNLKAGDVVLKKTGEQYHSYRVSFKKDDEGICLTYTDASVVETVSYDLVGTTWTYNSQDVFKLQTASATKLGVIKVGSGLSITSGGVLNATGVSLYRHIIYVKFDSTHYGCFTIISTSATRLANYKALEVLEKYSEEKGVIYELEQAAAFDATKEILLEFGHIVSPLLANPEYIVTADNFEDYQSYAYYRTNERVVSYDIMNNITSIEDVYIKQL